MSANFTNKIKKTTTIENTKMYCNNENNIQLAVLEILSYKYMEFSILHAA